jgi:glycosyltransferase involved in cell wall biosynthesis
VKSILIVTDAWHPQVNGPVRMMQKIKDLLEARGYAVPVISPADFRTIPMPGYGEIELSLTTQRQVGKKIEALRPDAIHIAIEGTLGWAARNYCVKAGLPFSTAYHTQFPEYIRARAPVPVGVSYAVLKKFHSAAAWCLTPTKRVDDALKARGFTNTFVWHRGVDTALFNPAKRIVSGPDAPWPRPVFLHVGRIAVEKNIEAFLKLDLPGTKLVVGDGPLKSALEKRYPNAVFVGRAPDDKLAMYYASADVFVFPSLTDTLGLVLLEALASGTPVATFPVTGPIDVLGDAPVGVMSGDLAVAAQAALKLSRNAARLYAETFSWERSCDQFLEHLPWIAR